MQHFLCLQVPFAGIGNDVKVRVPITINSGIDAPVQLDQPGSCTGDGDAPPPPPMLDLPPYVRCDTSHWQCAFNRRRCRAYWDVNDRDWGNLDEKD